MNKIKKYLLLVLLVLFGIFNSKAHVNLVNPQGGETFSPGDIITIEWEEVLEHNTLNWDLLISKDGGITWDSLRSNISVNTLTYNWLIPSTPTTEGRIKIVQDNVDNDYEGISDDFTISYITSLGLEFENIEFNIYPNPMIDYSILEFNNPDLNPHTLTIYDSQGRLVRILSNIITDNAIVRRENLMRGIYFYQLSSDETIRAVGKLAVE